MEFAGLLFAVLSGDFTIFHSEQHGAQSIGFRLIMRNVQESNLFMAMHATCDHFVELTGADTATGRSYLLEPMTETAAGENPFIYLGVYDEDYRKIDGQWLIARCSLQFFWPERHVTNDFPGGFPSPQG